MRIGDLVRFKFPDSVVGALTALKYAKRMEARTGGRTGLVLEVHGNSALVNFDTEQILIHIMMLEIISDEETRK